MWVEPWELAVCGVVIFFLVCGTPLGMLVSSLIERRQYKRKQDSASHNSVRNASCANCRKNIDDDYCEAGGWYGDGSCKLWAPLNQHP